ncbi:MAG TPA: M48 family metallopeptidase [Clostridia bacterium]|nr:M48 family metallopeptidase [Clostridia bacterium]
MQRKGNLNFTWKLLLLPVELIDYIVVHELSHYRQMNHSARFWDIVGSVMPDYKEKRKKLSAILKEGYISFWN